MPEPAAVAVFAADHGVHARGVTPWPQEVTAQMVANFLAGGAVVNAFAAQAGADVVVIDVGVAADLPPAPGLLASEGGQGHGRLPGRPGADARPGGGRRWRPASGWPGTWWRRAPTA